MTPSDTTSPCNGRAAPEASLISSETPEFCSPAKPMITPVGPCERNRFSGGRVTSRNSIGTLVPFDSVRGQGNARPNMNTASAHLVPCDPIVPDEVPASLLQPRHAAPQI